MKDKIDQKNEENYKKTTWFLNSVVDILNSYQTLRVFISLF